MVILLHFLLSLLFYSLLIDLFHVNLFIYRSVRWTVLLHSPFYLHLFGDTIISSLVRGSWRQFIGQIMTNYVGTKHSGISAKCSQQLLLYTWRHVESHKKMISLKMSFLIFGNYLWKNSWTHTGDIAYHSSVVQNQLSDGGNDLLGLLCHLLWIQNSGYGQQLVVHGYM